MRAVLLKTSTHPWPAGGEGLHLAPRTGLRCMPAQVHRQSTPRLLLVNGRQESRERLSPDLAGDMACHEACNQRLSQRLSCSWLLRLGRPLTQPPSAMAFAQLPSAMASRASACAVPRLLGHHEILLSAPSASSCECGHSTREFAWAGRCTRVLSLLAQRRKNSGRKNIALVKCWSKPPRRAR